MNQQTTKKSGSGEHEAVVTYRRKLDSITEVTLPLARTLNERIDRAMRAAEESGQAEDDEDEADQAGV